MNKQEQADKRQEEPIQADTSSEKDTAAQPEKMTDLPENEQEPCGDEAGTTQEEAGETGSDQEDDVEMLNKKLKEKEAALSELSDKYIRLAAEYDNFRRRSQKEKENLYAEAVSDVVKEWLAVLDNLDRAEFAAMQYEHEDAKKVCDGIVMIQKQVQEVLAKIGVEEIDCQGRPFDPEMHDAVMHVEDEGFDASTVAEVLRKGYAMKDRVIRHAMVKVAN